MKICLIGPGIIPIPPNGHGAVESLMWDYYNYLTKLNHDVDIINSPNRNEIISLVNEKEYDFVHIHYDCFYDIVDNIKCNNIGFSSHYPYIDQPDKYYFDDYGRIIDFMVKSPTINVFAISKKDRNTFIQRGVDASRIFLCENGVDESRFNFKEYPKHPDQTICLARIEPRKRQSLTKNINSVYYIGKGPMPHDNYLGEISDQYKLDNLTNYGNLILLSNGENGTPLVIKEALVTGLGIVVSEYAAHEIRGFNENFIDIIPEAKIHDEKYIEEILKKNRQNSLGKRKYIRDFAIKNFSWNKLLPQYIKNIESIIERNR